MSSTPRSIITPWEAEAFVESLEVFDLEDLGSDTWLTFHERVERLSMQTVLEAQEQTEEHVKDLLITQDKLSVLVKDLILTEVWREKIFPEIIKQNKKPKTSIGIYTVLHHEVTVMTLLEMTCFRLRSDVKTVSALETLGDLVLDLIDYCHRALVHLLAHPEIRHEPATLDDPPIETTLQYQHDSLRFMQAMQSVTLLQFICEDLGQLTVSAGSRLLRQHDLPLLLVQLLDERPWLRTNAAGKRQKFTNRSWVASPRDDMAVAKVEGQVWLSLLYIMTNKEHWSMYEISEYRRTQLLRLQTHLTDTLLDQIAPLASLRQWLAQLALGQAPPPRSSVIIETIPEVREALLTRHSATWSKVARRQLERYFRTDVASMQEQARRLAAVYDMDKLEPLITQVANCSACAEPAAKKCSRCKTVWYCGRQCQVKHWPVHKASCESV